MSELTMTTERVIPAPRERVFGAWLNPETLRRFMVPGEGMSVPKASSDATVGGRFEIVMRAGDQDLPHAGTYLTIDPHNQIVFTWESPYSQSDSEVTLDFAEEGEGTKLTLTHVRFVDEASRDQHKAGWAAILAALDTELV